MKILNNEDIENVPISLLLDAIAEFVAADFMGNTISPPRHAVDFPKGQLVFTTGGSERLAGFRAYETFQSSARSEEDQIIAVWDTESCAIRGVCFGNRLGALRTGALGGIAVNAMVPASASTCAVIGTGLQAEAQLRAILSQRQLTDVRVFSRKEENRTRFVDRFKEASRIRIFDDPAQAVCGAEIVVLATNAGTPVVKSEWLRECLHVTTVGPKFNVAHELPLDLIDEDFLLVSDSPQQIQRQGERHMLYGNARIDDLLHLGEVISKGRPALPLRSIFLSAGLSGTEVVALDAALSFLDERMSAFDR